MSNRKTKRRPAEPTASSRHLVRGNGESVRTKARKAYEQAKRKLDQAREELDRFKSVDEPAFQGWWHGTFGPELTVLRELARQYEEQIRLIEDVERVSYFEDISFVEAYRLVMRLRSQPPEQSPSGESSSEEDPAGEDWSRGEDESPGGDPFAEFAEAFKQAFGFEPPPELGGPRREEPPRSNSRVKELYRILARKLHPDAQDQMTTQKLEWWHEVQEAYAANDVERMELILGLCETQEGSAATHTSVSMLHRLTARLQASLRGLRRELSRCRREPSWNFSQAPDREAMKREIRFGLSKDVRELRQKVAECGQRIDQWAKHEEKRKSRPPKERRRNSGGKSPQNQSEFPF